MIFYLIVLFGVSVLCGLLGRVAYALSKKNQLLEQMLDDSEHKAWGLGLENQCLKWELRDTYGNLEMVLEYNDPDQLTLFTLPTIDHYRKR